VGICTIKKRVSSERIGVGSVCSLYPSEVRPLLPHQREALDYALSTSTPALFMEMRLGKTKVAIEWVRRIGMRRVLVVAPKSVLISWETELTTEKEGTFWYNSGSTIKRLKSMKEEFNMHRWFLINYEALQRMPELKDIGFDCVILDESTRIKNPTSKTTKTILSNFKNIRYKALLSGAPMPEGILDIVPQLLFLQGKVLNKYNFWQFRFCYTNRYGFDWVLRPKVHSELSDHLHNTCFFLSKKEAGIAIPKVYETRYVEPNSTQKKILKDLAKDFMTEISGKKYSTKWIPSNLMWMAQVASGFFDGNIINDGKARELLSLLKGELYKESVVVWFRFNAELKYVSKLLKENNITCTEFLGELSTTQRREVVAAFRTKRVRVLLVQIKTGLFGMDFSVSSTNVYFSNSYSYEERAQSEQRIEHPRKRHSLLTIDLVCKGTVDEEVLKSIKKKKLNAKILCTNMKKFLEDKYGYNS